MYCEQKRKLFDLYLRFNQIMTPQKLRRQDWRTGFVVAMLKAWAPSTTSLLRLSLNEFPLDNVYFGIKTKDL